MRIFGRALLAFAVAFLAVDLLSGQQFGGGFGGGFGGPGGGSLDPYTLVRNAQVKKELNITDEQMEKLPDAVMKALGEVLTEKQLKRLMEIELQQRGVRAYADPKIQKSLKFSTEQKDSVASIIEDNKKERAELLKDLKGGDFKGIGEKMQTLNKEFNEKLTAVLSADQKRSWKQLQGDEFKLEFGKGGFGKKGKKDNNKDDLD